MQIQYDGIKHTYRSPAGEPRTVLDIPEWSLQPGEQVLLRGVSGSGKTTLFNITAGLMRPTEGKVCFGEQSLYALPEAARDKFRSRNVGYIFQNHYLVNALTALENVEMPMAFVNDMPRKKRRAIASEVLAKVGLADHIHYRPEQMSTGQRLRVGIARALANNPAVLLADEPTAALDPENAAQAMELIQESCKQNN
ncbi:MAG: ABC transporter ATP-binding protein, partial [Chloroflexota bacterium]